MFALLEWLGPFIYAFNKDYPLLIGYLPEHADVLREQLLLTESSSTA